MCLLVLLNAGIGKEEAPQIGCVQCSGAFEKIFLKGDLEGAEEEISRGKSKCLLFFRYFLLSYLKRNQLAPEKEETPEPTGRILEALKCLIVALDAECEVRDLARLTYATKIFSQVNILGRPEEAGIYYKEMAEKVYNTFYDKRNTLFAKWEYKHLDREGENTKIIDFVKTLTRGGDAVAADNLLSLIRIGHVEAEQHLDFLRAAAAKGKIDAMGILGNMYLHGWGVKKSTITARHYFAEGAKYGDAACLNGLGMVHAQTNADESAKKLFEQAAAAGSPAADYNLFLMYEKKNNFLGELHLIRAARQEGYLPAVFRHGLKAWERKEYTVATTQFKNISEYSQLVLSLEALAVEQYKKGLTAALYTSLLIGDLGSGTGYKNAMHVLTYGPKRKTEKNDELRIIVGRRLADSGDAGAVISLGHAYFEGRGVPACEKTAFARYLAASVMGSSEGSYLVGWMHENGRGTPRSWEEALGAYGQMYKQNSSAYVLYLFVSARVLFRKYWGFLFRHTYFLIWFITRTVTGVLGGVSRLIWGTTSAHSTVPPLPGAQPVSSGSSISSLCFSGALGLLLGLVWVLMLQKSWGYFSNRIRTAPEKNGETEGEKEVKA